MPVFGNISRSAVRAIAAPAYALARRLPYGNPWDCIFTFLRFMVMHGRWPGRERSVNDYLVCRKCNGSLAEPLVVRTTDKDLAKSFIAEVAGSAHVVPTLAVLRSPEEVMAYTFPRRCIAKGTAASGRSMIVTDGVVDRQELIKWLGRNHYRFTREANYRPLTPKIIVEPLVFDTEQVIDYKLLAVAGKVKYVRCGVTRQGRRTARYYLPRDWRGLDFLWDRMLPDGDWERPANLDEMVAAAEAIGSHFDFVRVDLYSNGERFYVGEITHCPGSADFPICPPDSEPAFWTLLFGSQSR